MTTRIDRRGFLKGSIALGAGASMLGACTRAMDSVGAPSSALSSSTSDFPWRESTIADLQAAMSTGRATAVSVVRDHLARIEQLDWNGPRVNSIIEVNPDAEAIAEALDQERAAGHVRGPLHGIPIVLKDVLATADRMQTTAGSLALVGSTVPRDAGAVTRLREAGAIILGKANLSEWNAYRGWPLHGGWSGRAGMGRNPYALSFSTGDSSSGSAAAVAASFAAGGVGLETYGSIMMPSSLCGVVGLKPTLGLVSRSGTIPLSFTRDAVGPIARTVTDLAALLGGMVGVDPLDAMTKESAGRVPSDYTRFLDRGGLRGARIGVWRRHDLWNAESARTAAAVIEDVLRAFKEEGATLIDPVMLPHWVEATGYHGEVMYREIRPGIDRYLATLGNTEMRHLEDIIAFNEAHPAEELRWHNQSTLESTLDSDPLSDPKYGEAVRLSTKLGQGDIDGVMRSYRLDAIVAPTFVRAWPINLLDGDPYVGNGVAGISNAAGYPNLTVPAGFADGLPIGISFLGRAWEEPTLLRLGHAFEQATNARRPPRFLETGTEFVER
jgi:amidase